MRNYVFRVPSGKVHLGTMHAGQRIMIRTSCGRWIEDTWTASEVSELQAVRAVTCALCLAAATRTQASRGHHVSK